MLTKILKIAILGVLIFLLVLAFTKAGGGGGGFLKDMFSSIKSGLTGGYSDISTMLVPKNR